MELPRQPVLHYGRVPATVCGSDRVSLLRGGQKARQGGSPRRGLQLHPPGHLPCRWRADHLRPFHGDRPIQRCCRPVHAEYSDALRRNADGGLRHEPDFRELLLRLRRPVQDPRGLLVAQQRLLAVLRFAGEVRQGLLLRLRLAAAETAQGGGCILGLPADASYTPEMAVEADKEDLCKNRKIRQPGVFHDAADLAVAADGLHHGDAPVRRPCGQIESDGGAEPVRLRGRGAVRGVLLRHPAGKRQAHGQGRPGHQGGRQISHRRVQELCR